MTKKKHIISFLAAEALEIDSVMDDYPVRGKENRTSKRCYIIDSNIIIDLAKSHEFDDLTSIDRQICDRLMRTLRFPTPDEKRFRICESHNNEVKGYARKKLLQFQRNEILLSKESKFYKNLVSKHDGSITALNQMHTDKHAKEALQKIKDSIDDKQIYPHLSLETEKEIEYFLEYGDYFSVEGANQQTPQDQKIAIAFSHLLMKISERPYQAAYNDGLAFVALSKLAVLGDAVDLTGIKTSFSFITKDGSFAFFNRLVRCFKFDQCLPTRMFDHLLYGYDYQSTFNTNILARETYSVLLYNFERILTYEIKNRPLLLLFLASPNLANMLVTYIKTCEQNKADGETLNEQLNVLQIDKERVLQEHDEAQTLSKELERELSQIDSKYYLHDPSNQNAKKIASDAKNFLNKTVKKIREGKPLEDNITRLRNVRSSLEGRSKSQFRDRTISMLQRASLRLNDAWLSAVIAVSDADIELTFYLPPALPISGSEIIKKANKSLVGKTPTLMINEAISNSIKNPAIQAIESAYFLSLLGKYIEADSYVAEAASLLRPSDKNLQKELTIMRCHIERCRNMGLSTDRGAKINSLTKSIRQNIATKDYSDEENMLNSYARAIITDNLIVKYLEVKTLSEDVSHLFNEAINSCSSESASINKQYELCLKLSDYHGVNQYVVGLATLQLAICEFWIQLVSSLAKQKVSDIGFSLNLEKCFHVEKDLSTIGDVEILNFFHEHKVAHFIKALISRCDTMEQAQSINNIQPHEWAVLQEILDSPGCPRGYAALLTELKGHYPTS